MSNLNIFQNSTKTVPKSDEQIVRIKFDKPDMAGRTPEPKQSGQLGISHAVRFLGFQRNGTLTDLYKACDVVCVPSRNEPFGIVLLEAWSCCKPVVSTVNGGPAEFVWHEVNGLKVYANPDSIAWGLGTLFTNFEWARWMGRNGRVAVETAFSWDTIADQVLGVYGSVSAARGAAA